MTGRVLRIAALLLAAATLSACSSVPDWVDPTTWIGDDNSTTAAAPPADESGQGQTVAEASDNGQTTADQSGQYPDLANSPSAPPPPSSAQDQTQLADQLAADRNHAQYSGDALRGGTEAAAAPPPPPGATPDIAPVSTGNSDQESAQAGGDQDNGDQSADNSSSDNSQADNSQSDNSGSSDTVDADAAANGNAAPPPPADQNTPAVTADNGSGDNGEDNGAAPADSSAPTTDVASANVPPPANASGAMPAVPAVPPNGAMPGMMVADAPLGFKPSTAAPLDPSVSQFVAAPIVARYQQTASNAGMSVNTIAPAGYTEGGQAVALNAPAATSRAQLQSGSTDVGGPEAMDGSVVANFDALNGGASTSVYANPYGTPAAVVYFPNDVAAIGPQGRAQIELAVQAWKARGGSGFIRVVGHSSSRTPNMPVEKHLELIFKRSQAYANAVATALIHAGVPAKQVLIEAVGDSQPVYYESMPQGETGNRRAEIYIQG